MTYIFRPDGVFVHKRKDGMLPRVRRSNSPVSPEDLQWSEVLVSVDLKRDKTILMTDSKFVSVLARMTSEELQKRLGELQVQIKLNPREQVASYALEALSSNALKSTTLGMVVVNDMIEMWYFDRAGCLGSDVLELRKEDDFDIFVNAVVAIASASPSDLDASRMKDVGHSCSVVVPFPFPLLIPDALPSMPRFYPMIRLTLVEDYRGEAHAFSLLECGMI